MTPRRHRAIGWVKLDPTAARAHPAYGVYGWSLVLLVALFVGPVILLWQDVEIAYGPYDRPARTWLLIVIDGLLLACAWTACRMLGSERRGFKAWYAATALIGVLSLAAFATFCLADVRAYLAPGPTAAPAATWPEGSLTALIADMPPIVMSGLGLRALGLVVATCYVLWSQRLEVTLAKRVRPDDPFLRVMERCAPGPESADPDAATATS